ncbi:MAG: hypothetical protein IT385_09060 [Deltaproteobacteria bacterium]|nr:hypothetical protein [Deltaproteobacteria bacterium]
MTRRAPRLALALVATTVAAACDAPLDESPITISTALDPGDERCGDVRLGPPSFPDGGARAAVVDVTDIYAAFTLDFARRVLSARATMRFMTGPDGGHAVFDLRRPIDRATLDGEPLVIGRDLVRRDPRLQRDPSVLVIRRPLAPCSEHALELEYRVMRTSYRLDYPRWDEPTPFLSDFSDGEERRLLESIAPAPITLADAFRLTIDLHLDTPPAVFDVFTNGDRVRLGRQAWRITWPDDSDVMTPLFVVADTSRWRSLADPRGLVELRWNQGFEPGGPYSSRLPPEEILAVAHETLDDLEARFGPRRWGHRPFLVLLTPISPAGMEYPNGTLIGFLDRYVLQHEITHAWFGRTVMPARHLDAWFDEGITTWQSAVGGNWWALDPDSPGATPLTSGDPWERRTSKDAHGKGGRVFETLIERFGDDTVQGLLAWLVAQCHGAHVTHHDLRRAFRTLGDPDFVDALFLSWVIADGDADVRGTCPAVGDLP